MASLSSSGGGDRIPVRHRAAWQAWAGLLTIVLLAVYMLTPKRIDALLQSYVWIGGLVRLAFARGA